MVDRTSAANPFQVGDEVVFAPDQRTVGWYQHAFDRWGVVPGQVGLVTAIDADIVEMDGRKAAAMHWSQFKSPQQLAASERERMRADYLRRVK